MKIIKIEQLGSLRKDENDHAFHQRRKTGHPQNIKSLFSGTDPAHFFHNQIKKHRLDQDQSVDANTTHEHVKKHSHSRHHRGITANCRVDSSMIHQTSHHDAVNNANQNEDDHR